ncbi:protein LURP-one-related 15-like [Fagus crenata]
MATPIVVQSPPIPAPTPAPDTQLVTPVPVISPQYCELHPFDLAIVRKVRICSSGNFVVTDTNGNVIFNVKARASLFRDRRVLFDAAGNPVVTLREKIISRRSRWQVFRGESEDPSDLIFSVRQSSAFHWTKTKYYVYLANNNNEDVCDYKIEQSGSCKRSCIIYAGVSSTVVAQMHEKRTVKSVLTGKDNFMVTVYPNIDHAFIIALIVILDAIDESRSSS